MPTRLTSSASVGPSGPSEGTKCTTTWTAAMNHIPAETTRRVSRSVRGRSPRSPLEKNRSPTSRNTTKAMRWVRSAKLPTNRNDTIT